MHKPSEVQILAVKVCEGHSKLNVRINAATQHIMSLFKINHCYSCVVDPTPSLVMVCI